MEHTAILEKTVNQMPPIFTSYQFNTIAKKNGYPPTLLKDRGLSKFLHQHATNAGANSKTWVKSDTKITPALPVKKVMDVDELNQKYLRALKVIHQGLKYSDKINLSKVVDEFGLSKDVYKPLQEGGILTTNGKVGAGCRYSWTSKSPCLAMAIELRDRVGKNSVKRQPSEAVKAKSNTPQKVKPKTIVKSYFWGLFKSTTTQ